MEVIPMSISDAKAYVGQYHRHHRPPQGGLFAVGASEDGEVIGCAIVGRPVARFLQDGWTCEVTRLCTNGAKNAPSMLYRACVRAAMALGYKRVVTYTLPEEGGASLRGAGFRCLGKAGGGSWSVPSRPRVDRHPLQTKLRWQVERGE